MRSNYEISHIWKAYKIFIFRRFDAFFFSLNLSSSLFTQTHYIYTYFEHRPSDRFPLYLYIVDSKYDRH